VQIYGADDVNSSYPYGDSTPLAARGWHGPLASAENVHDRQRIRLTGAGASTAYRYYLVWLTTLPPGEESASISELTLFK
jgi:hypothetical protein